MSKNDKNILSWGYGILGDNTLDKYHKLKRCIQIEHSHVACVFANMLYIEVFISRLSVSIRPVWDLYQNKFNIKFYPDYERSCKKTSQIHQLAHINISIYRLIHAQSVATVLSHKCGYRYHQSDATKIGFFFWNFFLYFRS